MKAIGVVDLISESAIFLYWDPGKPHTIVLYRKSLYSEYFNVGYCKAIWIP